MALYDAASYREDWFDDLDADDPALYEDRSALYRTTQSLGLSTRYVPEWGPEEAFREFKQNW
jgi:hypothetical protein